MSQDPLRHRLLPALFAHRLNDIQDAARSVGYAIAVHGSMQRDFDLVAIPWTDDAVSAEALVEHLKEELQLNGMPDDPTDKPHGRKSWTLFMCDSLFMDLSVIPTRKDQA